jgi:hypothetical protein
MGSCAHNHAKATLGKPINRVRRGSVVTDTTKSVVLDRELEEEKKPAESEPPRIRCPLCGWSPRKEDRWSCSCGHEWNTFDTGGVCPACLQTQAASFRSYPSRSRKPPDTSRFYFSPDFRCGSCSVRRRADRDTRYVRNRRTLSQNVGRL